jgi:hypothetical protein
LGRSARHGRHLRQVPQRSGDSPSGGAGTPTNSPAALVPESAESVVHAGSSAAQSGDGAQLTAVDPRATLTTVASAPALAATRAAARAALAPPLHAVPAVTKLVAGAGHAVHSAVTQTVGAVTGTVSTVTGTVSAANGALTSATAPLNGSASSLPSAAAGVGQAATGAVAGVVGSATQAVGSGAGAAASVAAQSTATLTQAAAPFLRRVVVGATGAVSALGKTLGGG